MKRLDALGDRLKSYETQETGDKFLPMVPVYARIDGRSFSKFTKGMKRPYDENMSRIMVEVTKYLVEETNALTGYTQSDEISLVWLQEHPKSDIFFSGKKQKMVSTLAALATAKFLELALQYWPNKCTKRLPTFDTRVFQVPNKTEGMNCFLWRVQDAVKNSITMAASHHYSHKQLHGKNGNAKLDMLMDVGVNWNDYPQFFKEGSFIKRMQYTKTVGENECLRTQVVCVALDKFGDLNSEERTEFIFAKYFGGL